MDSTITNVDAVVTDGLAAETEWRHRSADRRATRRITHPQLPAGWGLSPLMAGFVASGRRLADQGLQLVVAPTPEIMTPDKARATVRELMQAPDGHAQAHQFVTSLRRTGEYLPAAQEFAALGGVL